MNKNFLVLDFTRLNKNIIFKFKEYNFDKSKWHKKYKIGKDIKGRYTGEIIKK